jgi:hypothetical protein
MSFDLAWIMTLPKFFRWGEFCHRLVALGIVDPPRWPWSGWQFAPYMHRAIAAGRIRRIGRGRYERVEK